MASTAEGLIGTRKLLRNMNRQVKFGLCAFLMFCSLFAFAQNEVGDTTIYDVVDEMPRFPACEGLDTTVEFKNGCAQRILLRIVNQNIIYPVKARELGSEGMVVAKFVVEKDGSLSNPEIVKDLEGGCGDEVLRVINGLNETGVKWVPGKLNGDTVRVRYALPVRFKLTEAPPFTMIEGDSIWVTVDSQLVYKGGYEQLMTDIKENLKYPNSGKDSCLIGSMDVKIKVDRDGSVDILDMVDLNNLGFDFWFEVTNTLTGTSQNWTPAMYQGQKVPTSYDLTVWFSPEEAHCKTKVDAFNQALALANEGQALFDSGEEDSGIEKMTDALNLYPEYPEFLFLRGQSYMSMNKFAEACVDLQLGQKLSNVNWFSNIIPVLCASGQEEEKN